MKNIELNIGALNASSTSIGNFVVVLQDSENIRRLPITIGLQEAQAIAVSLEQMQPLRPLTHDLFLNTIVFLGASIESVKIIGIKDEAYYSIIMVKDFQNNMIEIDSRTSDAIALAIRSNCPILIGEDLWNERAVAESGQGKIFSEKRGQLEQYSLSELYDMLANLLEKEDYESASILRDIIDKKNAL